MLLQPIHQSHLSIAHDIWLPIIKKAYYIVDATLGKGKDSLFLASHMSDRAHLWSLDIQKSAIDQASIFLSDHLSKETLERVHIIQQSHSEPIKTHTPILFDLVIYNLGYLPGGDVSICTYKETSLKSLQLFLNNLHENGHICITAYPGHKEGLEEYLYLREFLHFEVSQQKNIVHFFHPGKPTAPTIFWIQPRK